MVEAPEVRRPKTVAPAGTVTHEQELIRRKEWRRRRAAEVDAGRDLPPVGWEPNTTKPRKGKPKGGE